MPQESDELIIPPYPRSGLAHEITIGDVESIQSELKGLQGKANAARMLSWNAYDQDTQNIVSDFNNYLRTTPGYVSLDWRLIKAMLWAETGPHARKDLWKTQPMQSANPHDLGWPEMMRSSNKDRMHLIVPPNLRGAVASPNLSPRDNIVAGVAYLLYSAAETGPKTLIDKKDVKTVTVVRGDSLDLIARRVGTTEPVLKDMNSRMTLFPLQPGMKLTYSPAKTVTAILGWRPINPQSTYRLYNGHPGTDYGNKVQFLYDLIKQNRVLH